MDERYLEKRRGIDRFFTEEKKIVDSGKVVVSPSGHYQLEIYRYSTGPNSWNYSRGIVTHISDNKAIADIKRNYGHFWYAWTEHPNGNEYLLCGEDYQGYSIVNLTKGIYHTYFPEKGHDGWGFCWTAVYPSPDGLVLAVEGCYWACPYEAVFYDFKVPEQLPFSELARIKNLDACEGWADNETFVLKREIEIRKSDGVPYDALTEEEQEIFDSDPSLSDYKIETVYYKRSDFPKDA